MANNGEQDLVRSDVNINVSKFVEQFDKYEEVYSHEKLIRLISGKLDGKAKNWFSGEKGSWFRSLDGFKREFKEIFGKDQCSHNEEFIQCLMKGTKSGFLEVRVIELFGISKTSTLKRVEIINILCKNMDEYDRERMDKTLDWKESIQLARKFDTEFNNVIHRNKLYQNKSKYNQSKSYSYENKNKYDQGKPESVENKNKYTPNKSNLSNKKFDISSFRCHNCGEQGHFRNSCPKGIDKNTENMNMTIAIGNRTFITVEIAR